MIIVVSGQPGNGKTLMALELMRAEYDRNQAQVKAGKEDPRRFFTNIDGATQRENPGAFAWVEEMPADNDWRKLPHGAYVVYDEAHSDGKTEGLERYGHLFPGTGRPGESEDERIRAMSTHRHSGKDLVFVTQWPSKIHHNIRQLAGKHVHMNRAMGLQRSGVLTWTRVQADPYDESQREKAEEEIWAFPQDLYGRYKSATLHTATYKFRVPRKIWSALSMLIVGLLVAWGLWIFVFKPLGKKKDDQPAPAGAAIAQALTSAGGPPAAAPLTVRAYLRRLQPRVPAMPWSAPAFDGREVVSEPRLFCASAQAGLDADGVHREASCTCLTEQGTRYRINKADCRDLASNGEAYNPFRQPLAAQTTAAAPATAEAAPRSNSGPSIAMLTAPQIAGYGDIAVGIPAQEKGP
jgi:hypothetical protein